MTLFDNIVSLPSGGSKSWRVQKIKMQALASYRSYSTVAVNARAVPENEEPNSPTSQVSAYSLYSSVAVNARAVPQDEFKQVSPYSTFSAVTANARNLPQDASHDTVQSPAKGKRGQSARHFDDSSHSIPKPEALIFESGMRTLTEEQSASYASRQTSLEPSASDSAKLMSHSIPKTEALRFESGERTLTEEPRTIYVSRQTSLESPPFDSAKLMNTETEETATSDQSGDFNPDMIPEFV